jgi:hypothetical protein
MTGQPPKSLSLSLAKLELSEDGCLTGRPVVLMSGTFSELCMLGAVSVLFIPGIIAFTELCMLGVVNVPLMSVGVTLALMLGVSRGVEDVGWVVKGGGQVLGEVGEKGGG